MAAPSTHTTLTRSAIAVIALLIAIGVVVWVLLSMMGCGAANEAASGDAAGSESTENAAASSAEAWLPVGGTLSSENPETGEMETAASITVARDASGRVASFTEASFASGVESDTVETRFTYDEAGRVATREVAYTDAAASSTAEPAPDPIVSDYTYDEDGRLTIISTPEAGSTGRELFDYNEQGGLITIMQTYDLEASSETFITHLTYDEQGLPVAATVGEGDATPSATWTYGNDGRLVAFSTLPLGRTATNLMDYALTYDESGRVASVACAPGAAVASASGDSEESGYDASVAYTYDEQGRCSGAHATGTYTYGATFETSAKCTYDDHGNLTHVDFTDENTLDGETSTQRYAIELEFQRFDLEEGASAASTALLLAPSLDKQLFALYRTEPQVPVTPNFTPAIPSATYLGYQQVLGSH